jgi:hypothetical protein
MLLVFLTQGCCDKYKDLYEYVCIYINCTDVSSTDFNEEGWIKYSFNYIQSQGGQIECIV